MHRTHTVSVGIAATPEQVYAYAADLTNMPAWAPGFAHSIAQRDDGWIAQTSLGEARVRIAAPNEFGVLDHDVELASGTFHNSMRVIPNGRGSEVLFTLVQLPGISDEQFKVDLDTVRADLNKLRTVLEHRYNGGS